MKILKLTSLICGGLLTVTGGSLLAQTSSSSSPSSMPQSSSSLGQSASSEALGASAMQSQKNVRLSQLLHSTVQSEQGQTLGTLRDVTVDPKTGQIQFAILSPSATAQSSSAAGSATAGKLIPVPWQLFSQSWSANQAQAGAAAGGMQKLVLNIDQSKLQSAPSFSPSDWTQIHSGSFDQQVYSHFGVSPATGIGTPGASISGQGAGQVGGSQQQGMPQSQQPQPQPQEQEQGTQPPR